MQHPFRVWDRQSWDERSAILDTRFHRTDVYFTPLIGTSMIMPVGVGWNDYWYTGGEIVQSHVNHQPIGREDRFTVPLYADMRQRRVRSRRRYGAKIQYSRTHQMVTRYGSDTPSFITRVLADQLADNVVGQMEKIARDGLLDNALFKFLSSNGAAWSLGSADFSNISADESSLFQLSLLEDIALRMSYRVEDTLHAWGDYAMPVPGANFRGNVLVLTTTGVFHGIWGAEAHDWMIDLRQLRDERIINGGAIQYRNMVIADTGHALVLWNAGNITSQVAVTRPINWGDGSPDPDSEGVDNVWFTGQSSDEVKHYIQCTNLSADTFLAGDFLTLHTARTAEYGITDGVDPLHGKSYRVEVVSVDASNNRVVVRKPITEEYKEAFSYSTLAGSSSSGQAYAFLTKGQHVHPTIIVGAREMVQFVKRRQPSGELIEYHRPTDNDADFPSVERVTANWFGEANPWNLDVYEVFYGSGKFANRGAASF